ncbi:MAG TPA: SAM-dependent methyltransferase [Enterovirga sp.]
MAEDRLSQIRAEYARRLMQSAGRDNERVEAAFAAVSRERYLTPPPWRIFSPGWGLDLVSAEPAELYADVLVALDDPKRINNGQPSLHAAWIAATDPQRGETVVQIGIGAGYYTAILAALVGPEGRVEAYEIEPHLAEIARNNLAGLSQVRVHARTGVGVALPSADVVYVSAGVAAPDPGWLRALRPSGRMVFPWQPDRSGGLALLVRRVPEGFRAEPFMHVAFVDCIGAGDAEARPRMTVPSRRLGDTRSLWLSAATPPDETATAVYADVWFSSRELESAGPRQAML